jgi:hypothetical protein
LDEINPVTGTVRQSVALNSIASLSNPACTLTGSGYAQEGIPALSQDNGVYMFGCYNVSAGGTVAAYLAPAARMIVRVYPDFTYDMNMYCTDCFNGLIFTSVVSVDGVNSFYLSGGQFQSSNIATASPTAENLSGGVRYMGTY